MSEEDKEVDVVEYLHRIIDSVSIGDLFVQFVEEYERANHCEIVFCDSQWDDPIGKYPFTFSYCTDEELEAMRKENEPKLLGE
jgi:hypothetical protein